MLWLIAALFAPPAHAEDLTILVGPDVSHVALVCGLDHYDKATSAGKTRADGRVAVTFPIQPGRDCKVLLTAVVPGDYEQLGTWACTPAGCTKAGGNQAPTVTAAPGELHVLMGPGLTQTELELSCVSGYRQRTDVADHQGVFKGMNSSDNDCTLNFKGGPPMRFRPIGPGVWQCHLVSDTPVCKKR